MMKNEDTKFRDKRELLVKFKAITSEIIDLLSEECDEYVGLQLATESDWRDHIAGSWLYLNSPEKLDEDVAKFHAALPDMTVRQIAELTTKEWEALYTKHVDKYLMADLKQIREEREAEEVQLRRRRDVLRWVLLKKGVKCPFYPSYAFEPRFVGGDICTPNCEHYGREYDGGVVCTHPTGKDLAEDDKSVKVPMIEILVDLESIRKNPRAGKTLAAMIPGKRQEDGSREVSPVHTLEPGGEWLYTHECSYGEIFVTCRECGRQFEVEKMTKASYEDDDGFDVEFSQCPFCGRPSPIWERIVWETIKEALARKEKANDKG